MWARCSVAFGIVVVAFLLAACAKQARPVVDPAPNAKNATVCPESRDLVCVGGTDCSMNEERGCRACRCADFSNGTLAPAH